MQNTHNVTINMPSFPVCPSAVAAKIAICGMTVWKSNYPWYHIAIINKSRLSTSTIVSRLTNDIKYIKYYTGMCNYGLSSFHLCDDNLNEIVKLDNTEITQIDLYDAIEPYNYPIKAIK